MKKITVKSTVEVASSDAEAIVWGGYQIPFIRYADGVLYVKFMGRRDCVETIGLEDLDPVYASYDGGLSWKKSDLSAWRRAAMLIPNGDRIDFVERENTCGSFQLPPPKKEGASGGDSNVAVYSIDEISHIVKGVEKTFTLSRLKSGETDPIEEICKVNWEDMPVSCYFKNDGVLIRNINPEQCDFKVDKNGILWLPVYGNAVASENESLSSAFFSTHLLRSDDMGHTWDYVSTVYYDPELNEKDAYSVEGFNEATVEILDNGDIILIIRSGSLHPFKQNGRPIPKMFIVRSSDEGKTWTKPQPFYDYGIHPHSYKTQDGTILMISGRPGVYLRMCDAEGKNWSEITEIVHVPQEDVMTKYFEYTCSNADMCICDDGRVFVTYSKFFQDIENGTHKKSIMVSEICLED